MSQLILASSSPRRKELLARIGVAFEICPAKGEEIISSTEPSDVVMELSEQKAKEVAAMIRQYNESHKELTTPQDILVIGADTVVAAEGAILGKPKDEEDAFRMLSMLSGKTHGVYTGVTFVFIYKTGRAGAHTFFERTEVSMSLLRESRWIRRALTGFRENARYISKK